MTLLMNTHCCAPSHGQLKLNNHGVQPATTVHEYDAVKTWMTEALVMVQQ